MINRIIAFLVAALLAWTGSLPSEAAQNGKEENIYVNLKSDGSVNEIYVVNTFYLSADGLVTDYGRYRTVNNMVSDQEMTVSKDMVSVSAEKGRFSYQGTLKNKELPWNIGLRYTLNGREAQADTLAGANGKLKMTIAVTENSGGQEAFYDHFLMRITVTLDMNRCSNISAPGASVENAGMDKKLIYYLLPGTEKTVDITADVLDFAMDSILFDAVASSLQAAEEDADTDLKDMSDEMEDLAARFKDDADTLTNNSSALAKGIEGFESSTGTLKDGMDEYNSGAAQLGDGIVSLKDGTVDLADGADGLHDGLVSMQEGISKLADSYQGDEGVIAGARKLADGAEKLSEGAGVVNKGVDAMVTAMASMTTQAEKQIDAQVPDKLWAAAAVFGIKDIQGDTVKEKLGYVKQQLSGLIKVNQDKKAEFFKALGIAAAASPFSVAGSSDEEIKEKSKMTESAEEASSIESDQDKTDNDWPEETTDENDVNESTQENDVNESQEEQTDTMVQTTESESVSQTENVPESPETQETEKESGPGETHSSDEKNSEPSSDSETRNQSAQQMNNKYMAVNFNRTRVNAGQAAYAEYRQGGYSGGDQTFISDTNRHIAMQLSSIVSPMGTQLSDLLKQMAECDAALTGMYQLNTQVESLLSMYSILESIGAQIQSSQLQELKTGVGQLTDGVKGLADAASALAGGLSQLSDGTSQLSGGMSEVLKGSFDLADGVADLRDGTDSLAEGYEVLTDASGGLGDGSSQLADGTGSLSDTVKDLTDSARKLTENSQDLIDKAQDMNQKADISANSTISATADLWQPVSFVSDKNSRVSLVQFAMQTAPVNVQQTALVQMTEPKKSFWEKFVSLFSFDK